MKWCHDHALNDDCSPHPSLHRKQKEEGTNERNAMFARRMLSLQYSQFPVIISPPWIGTPNIFSRPSLRLRSCLLIHKFRPSLMLWSFKSISGPRRSVGHLPESGMIWRILSSRYSSSFRWHPGPFSPSSLQMQEINYLILSSKVRSSTQSNVYILYHRMEADSPDYKFFIETCSLDPRTPTLSILGLFPPGGIQNADDTTQCGVFFWMIEFRKWPRCDGRWLLELLGHDRNDYFQLRSGGFTL